MSSLTGKVVWITGASGGIGEALAVLAAQRGAKLVLSARRPAELERVRGRCLETIGAAIAVLPLDLANFDAEAAAQAAAEPFGPVDILVNNAGVSQRSLVLGTDIAVYRSLMEVDFFAPVALTRALLPSMLARGGGRIVMIGSVVGRVGTPRRAGYSAAKHALGGFTEAARAELWREGIRFTLVLPGYIRTEVSLNALTADGGRYGTMDRATDAGLSAQECARRIWRAVEKDRDEIVVARNEGVFLLLKRFAPGLFSFLLKRLARRV
jgi:short-subunit dehydrogenase